jgi:large subunit ribosomal protein L1
MLLRGRILAYFAKVKVQEAPKAKISEALKIIKDRAKAKFDETIDF